MAGREVIDLDQQNAKQRSSTNQQRPENSKRAPLHPRIAERDFDVPLENKHPFISFQFLLHRLLLQRITFTSCILQYSWKRTEEREKEIETERLENNE